MYFKVKKSNQINMNIFHYFFLSLKWLYINIRTVGSSKKYLQKNKILIIIIIIIIVIIIIIIIVIIVIIP